MSNFVNDLPAELIRLVRYILRSFYEFELYLVMDMLIHYPCIKEDQLAEILKLEGKIVRQYLMQLKAEKFINEKLTIETTNDGKQNKVLHFFINYKMMVNVIKYKLDNMRRQIESEEKQLTCRATYKCKHCGHHYSDLDMVDIFMTMRCIRCDDGIVDEDDSSLPKASSRNLLANFNTQTKPILDLLQKVEHIQLAPHILSPAPADYSYVIDGGNKTKAEMHQAIVNSINNSNHKWSGDKTRHFDLLSHTPISITISSNNDEEQTLTERIKSSAVLNTITSNNKNDLNDSIKPNNSLSSIFDKVKLHKAQSVPIKLNDHHSKQQINNNNSNNNNNHSTNGNINGLSHNNNKNQQQQLQLQLLQPQQQQHQQNKSKSLVDSIMDILIIHENKTFSNNKKLNGINGHHHNNTINGSNNHKKRDFNQISDELADSILSDLNNNHNLSDDDDINNNISKKRKLNGFYSDMDIDETQFYDNNTINDLIYNHNGKNGHHNNHHMNGNNNHYNENDNHTMMIDIDSENDTSHTYYHKNGNNNNNNNNGNNNNSNNGNHRNNDEFLIKIKHEYIPIEKITPDLIVNMNKQEKQIYIEKCRQLYTAMYEL